VAPHEDLEPGIAEILALAEADGATPAHLVPVEQARAGHEQETAHLSGPGDPVEAVEDADAAGVPVRIYRPAADAPLVAYFHGGGWACGSIESFDTACRALANASGCAIASVGYRLAPEAPFPGPLQDCLAVARALEPAAVAGDSAGANLAAVVARHLRDRLRFQLLVYPVVDAGCNTPSYNAFGQGWGLTAESMRRWWDVYLDGADGLHPDASPLRADDLDGVPPGLVVLASHDVLRDEGAEYAARAGLDVLEVPGTIHGFWRWLARTPRAHEAIAAAGEALRRALRP
jgi:acetyl esterase